MMRLVIVSALVTFIFAEPQTLPRPMLDGRIIGGRPVKIEDFPYQISLQYYGSPICGGSIIGSRYVVTAAQCTAGTSTSALNIHAGTAKLNEGGVKMAVKTIHQNPNYDDVTIDYDISLLELASELQFSAKIDKVPLPNLNQEIPVGMDAVVSGWGVTEEGGSLPNQLQAVTVRTVSKADCIAAYGPESITDRMTCAGVPQGGMDACLGDSGGPLVSGGQLIGIVSWGYGCGRPEYPGVYGNVPILRDFIANVSAVLLSKIL